MKGFDKYRQQLYLCIYYKYDNNIIPNLPRIILTYLLNNIDKVNLYMNRKIHVGMILEYLSKKNLKEKEILNEIINYVEVICKNI